MKIITKSEYETIKLGEKMTKDFRGGMTIALTGDLGTGKTTLIKGVAKGLGIKKNITSPTFVLMKLYKTNAHEKRTKAHKVEQLCHVDAYRINDARELVDIGVLEYVDDKNTLTIIEWAEKVREILPRDTIWVRMGYGEKEDEREVIIDN